MKIRQLNIWLPVVVALATISVPLTAQDTKAADEKKATTSSEHSPAGTWEWDRETPNGDIHCVLKLKEKDGKVSGEFTNGNVDAKIKEGTFKDGKVELKFTVSVEDQDIDVTLSGKVGEDKIEGKVVVNTPEGDQELDWLAKRSFPLADAAGKWRMFFTTPDGVEMRPEFELKEKDGKAEVKFIDDDGIDVTETKYDNGNLKFSIELDFQGQALEVEYDLNLEGNDLYGILFFSFVNADQEGELDVEGSRFK